MNILDLLTYLPSTSKTKETSIQYSLSLLETLKAYFSPLVSIFDELISSLCLMEKSKINAGMNSADCHNFI